jgi:NADPH-dependent ferric siderophore reductase
MHQQSLSIARSGNPSIPSATIEAQRLRYPIRVRTLVITAIEALTPQMRRLTFSGEDLADFESRGFDDHLKLLLPAPGQSEIIVPPVGANGLPDWAAVPGAKPVARDYTPRRFDRAAGTLAIDFALHGSGPASRWAAAARVGDKAWIAGPRGSLLLPLDLEWQWLIGDASALPAIASRLEELPDSVAATVIIETAPDEALPTLPLGPASRLLRVVHSGQDAAPLMDAVRALPTPVGRGHVFAAAESQAVKALRAVLLEQHRFDKSQVRASAYWKRGADAHHETLAD